VAACPVLAERFAVVGEHDDDGPLLEAELGEGSEELAQEVVSFADGAVIGVEVASVTRGDLRCGGALLPFRRVGEEPSIRLRRHVGIVRLVRVEEEEETLIAMVPQIADAVVEGLAAALRFTEGPLDEAVEAVPEPERAGDERVLGEGCGREAPVAEALRQEWQGARRRQPAAPGLSLGVEAGEEAQVRGVGLGERRAHVGEGRAARDHLGVQVRRGGASVAVAGEVVGAERVERDEDEVPDVPAIDFGDPRHRPHRTARGRGSSLGLRGERKPARFAGHRKGDARVVPARIGSRIDGPLEDLELVTAREPRGEADRGDVSTSLRREQAVAELEVTFGRNREGTALEPSGRKQQCLEAQVEVDGSDRVGQLLRGCGVDQCRARGVVGAAVETPAALELTSEQGPREIGEGAVGQAGGHREALQRDREGAGRQVARALGDRDRQPHLASLGCEAETESDRDAHRSDHRRSRLVTDLRDRSVVRVVLQAKIDRPQSGRDALDRLRGVSTGDGEHEGEPEETRRASRRRGEGMVTRISLHRGSIGARDDGVAPQKRVSAARGTLGRPYRRSGESATRNQRGGAHLGPSRDRRLVRAREAA
jgi:hypothetical protein